MEVDRIPAALEHGRSKIVVEQDPWDAADLPERPDVTADEILESLVEEELDDESAGPRQHEDEARQAAPGAADRRAANDASYDAASGKFTIPPRPAVVYVVN